MSKPKFKVSKKFIYFLIRFILVYVLTYIFIGVIFKNFENYTFFIILNDFSNFRASDSLLIRLAPFIQILRSAFFAAILYPFYEKIIKSDYAWQRLFLILWGFSLIGAYAPVPASIEGLIYTKLSVSQHLISLVKPTVHIFVFCWFFVKWENRTERNYN